MPEMFIHAIVLAALSVPGTPPVARTKASPRVAVTSTTLFLRGGLKPDVRAVYRRLERGLARAGLEVLTARQVLRDLASRPNLQGCETPRCLIDIGNLLDAVFCAKIKARGNRREVQLEVVVTWAHSGLVAIRARGRCRGCTAATFEQELGRLAAVAGRKAMQAYRDTPPPRRRTRPRPNGGKQVPPPLSRPYRIAGATLLATGLAAAITGAVLLALDGRDRPGRNPLTERHQIMDSKAGGVTVTAIGISAALTGVGMLVYWLLLRKRRRPAVGLTVDPKRGRALLTGRFEF